MPSEDPLELAVQTLAELKAEHYRTIPSAQLGIERITAALGKPWFAWVAVVFVVAWIGLNLAYAATNHHALDRPQFPILELIVSLASLLIAVLILITQNRQNQVAHQRAEITLQLSVVTEQKVAKIIDLLEQLRRDDPHLPDREDRAAQKMARAIDVREAASELQKAEQRGYE